MNFWNQFAQKQEMSRPKRAYAPSSITSITTKTKSLTSMSQNSLLRQQAMESAMTISLKCCIPFMLINKQAPMNQLFLKNFTKLWPNFIKNDSLQHASCHTASYSIIISSLHLLIMYDNLDADRNWSNLIKIGEAGPINWQQGVMCFIVGWKRFTNSTWDKKYQVYRRQVQQKIDQLRISLDFPKLINKFLTHLLISLLISVIIFIAACFMPDNWQVLKPISFGQLFVWNIVYLVWSLVLVKVMRGSIRKGFRNIQSTLPELRLQFSMFCDCCCKCINQNYVTIYLKE